ncbi:MAG TPA: tryptophan synthase subunit alpha [Candidatus Eremiobacteraceae bacterium]|nr:tryptophan synthase subunit alpha [Candidatus Eremiobacteraceae bacterium]
MSIAGAFARCGAAGRTAFIPYVMAGHPSVSATAAILHAACEAGADVIEVGIPYSDPLADGPIIRAAATRALSRGTTFEGVLAMVSALDRRAVPAPLVAFTYCNPVFVRGVERTAHDLARAGFAAAILPDLPPEEAQPVRAALAREGLGLVLLVAPTTPPDRVREIALASDEFVYVVSRLGVTGTSVPPSEVARRLVSEVRTATSKPVAVGFGVSTPEQARAIAAFADGVIVGSALVARVAESPGREEAAVREYCGSLAAALVREPVA